METLNLSVFSREGYERIQTDKSKVPVIGKTEIDEDERAILQKHPKIDKWKKIEPRKVPDRKGELRGLQTQMGIRQRRKYQRKIL